MKNDVDVVAQLAALSAAQSTLAIAASSGEPEAVVRELAQAERVSVESGLAQTVLDVAFAMAPNCWALPARARGVAKRYPAPMPGILDAVGDAASLLREAEERGHSAVSLSAGRVLFEVRDRRVVLSGESRSVIPARPVDVRILLSAPLPTPRIFCVERLVLRDFGMVASVVGELWERLYGRPEGTALPPMGTLVVEDLLWIDSLGLVVPRMGW